MKPLGWIVVLLLGLSPYIQAQMSNPYEAVIQFHQEQLREKQRSADPKERRMQMQAYFIERAFLKPFFDMQRQVTLLDENEQSFGASQYGEFQRGLMVRYLSEYLAKRDIMKMEEKHQRGATDIARPELEFRDF